MTPGRAFILGERKRGVQGRDEEQPTCFLLLLLLLLSAKKNKWSPSSACRSGGVCGATVQVSFESRK